MPKPKDLFLYISPKEPWPYRIQIVSHLNHNTFGSLQQLFEERKRFFPEQTRPGWVVDKSFLFSLS